MSKKNNEEDIQFDRDTTKPEQKLVKKTKKVDGTTQTKKEENLQKQSKTNLKQENKDIQSSSPQNKRQQQEKKTSKNKDDDSDDEEEENEEEEEENEEDEESENENKKQPLTIRNKKTKEDDDNNINNKDYYNDSELKQLLKNLKPIKPETTEKEIQCEIEKEQITQLTTQFEIDLKEKENQHQQTIINIQNTFNIKESEYLLQIDQNKKEIEFEKTTKIDTVSKLQKEIDIKDKNLKQLSNTNTKLRKSLSELSQQVNTLFTQLTSTKKVHEEEKAKRQKENNDSETALLAKEKELQNTINLVNILSKDNKKLQKMLDTYGDYNKKIELSDKVKYKEQNIEQLKQEVNKLKLLLDKHKKFETDKADYEK